MHTDLMAICWSKIGCKGRLYHVVLSCEYKRKEGEENLDDAVMYLGFRGVARRLPLTLGRPEVYMEHATCYAGRSVSPCHFWHDYRKFYDEDLVLLSLIGYCQ